MKVSVCITTYNHEKYIAQAIESVLTQQTNFDFEILIGEDDSTDSTRDIAIKYGDRFPEKIRLFLNSRKNVIYVNGRPTGRWNLVNNLRHATGKYVALLEGDDYWTDPLKLQHQVEILDENPAASMCFHDASIYDEASSSIISNNCPKELSTRVTIKDLLQINCIPTCSVMYRWGLLTSIPDWFFEVPMGDWPLHILHAQCGDAVYFKKVMAVHRHHDESLWSTARTNVAFGLARHEELLKHVDRHLGYRYTAVIMKGLTEAYINLGRGRRDLSLIKKARPHLIKYACLHFFDKEMTTYMLSALFLQCFTPHFYEGIRWLKKQLSRATSQLGILVR